MLQYDGEPVSHPKPAALKTDKKHLTGINKEVFLILPSMLCAKLFLFSS